MIPHTRKCFVIVVHFGDTQPTYRLINQLKQAAHSPDRIIVIDNGPHPHEGLEGDQQVTAINIGRNTGYAGGIEVGLGFLHAQQAQAEDIVIIYNNDVDLDHSDIARIRTWWDTQTQPVIAGGTFGSLNLVTGRTQITKSEPPVSGHTLSYIHGSMLTATYGTLSRLRMGDQYFMYWEDVYVSQRAHKKGIALAVIPGLQSSHPDAPSDTTDEKLYYLVRNGVLFLEQEVTRSWSIFWQAKNRLRLGYHNVVSRHPKRHIIEQAIRDGIHNKTGQVTL